MAVGEVKYLAFADGVVITSPPAAPSVGGGGGGSAVWNPPQGTGAMATELNGQLVYQFSPGGAEELVLTVKVPSTYTAGNPIGARLGYCSGQTTGNVRFLTSTYLLRKDLTDVSSVGTPEASTTAAQTNVSPALAAREFVVGLSTAGGLVNGVAVAPGDLLRVVLTRMTDTDTSSVYFVPGVTEVTFQ
jgi:hypothetical protein